MTRDDTKGADYKAKVTVTFEQAVYGAEVEVEMNKRVICNTCKGTRAEPGSGPRKCFECGGRGSYIGNYGIKKRCLKCNGAGCTPKSFCKSCEGLGVQRQVLTEKVSLPGGLNQGQKIKVPMLGHAADVFTSVSGDLLLTVEVSPHELFTADGKNIRSRVELSLTEAILGCTITVQTAHGPANVEVEPGMCTGSTVVLKHMGMPEFDPPEEYDEVSLRGDHIITFIVVNEAADSRRDELLRRFAELEVKNKDRFYAAYQTLRQQHRA